MKIELSVDDIYELQQSISSRIRSCQNFYGGNVPKEAQQVLDRLDKLAVKIGQQYIEQIATPTDRPEPKEDADE